MQKTIEVTITLTSENEFTLDFYEPESSDHICIEGDDSYDGSLIDRVGTELLSWVSIMKEEQEDVKKSAAEESENEYITPYVNDKEIFPDITKEEARKDILKYLESQSPEYFEKRSTTHLDVIQSEDIIQSLVDEHMHCVNRLGCNREWSCKDACDNDPGIRRVLWSSL